MVLGCQDDGGKAKIETRLNAVRSLGIKERNNPAFRPRLPAPPHHPTPLLPNPGLSAMRCHGRRPAIPFSQNRLADTPVRNGRWRPSSTSNNGPDRPGVVFIGLQPKRGTAAPAALSETAAVKGPLGPEQPARPRGGRDSQQVSPAAALQAEGSMLRQNPRAIGGFLAQPQPKPPGRGWCRPAAPNSALAGLVLFLASARWFPSHAGSR